MLVNKWQDKNKPITAPASLICSRTDTSNTKNPMMHLLGCFLFTALFRDHQSCRGAFCGSEVFQVTSLPPPSFITFGCWAVFFFFLSYLSFYWRADGGSNCHVCKEMCSLIVLTVCISPILSWLRLKDSPQTVEQYCWPVTLNCSFTKPSSNGECTTVWWHVSQSIHWSLHHFDILVKNRLVHSKFCLSNQGIGE